MRKADNYLSCFGLLRGCLLFMRRAGRDGGAPVVEVAVPGSGVKLLVRLDTSDVAVFKHTFHDLEHEWGFAKDPAVIVDAGAYTGLSAAYFAMRYPDARVIALEPSDENFALLARNVAPFKNVQAVKAALWAETGSLVVTDPGRGMWGFTVSRPDSITAEGDHVVARSTTPAITVEDVMRDYGIDRISLLKLDIEGSEKDVLADSAAWIGDVDALSVELHDRFKPGCSKAFYGATADFPVERRRGDLILAVREVSLLGVPA